jgi:signal transduction histidine kinase
MGLAQAPPPVVVLGPVELVVWADRDQLQRVLENLVRNAREAIGEGPGEVRIRLSAQGREVQIDVEDDGPGIPDRVLPLLFEVFRSGGKAGGTGLGLAISREIVRAHGGDVVLVSTGPSGTRFRVRLPLLEPRTVLSADV